MAIVHLDIEEFKAYQRDSDTLDKIVGMIEETRLSNDEFPNVLVIEIAELIQSTNREVKLNG